MTLAAPFFSDRDESICGDGSGSGGTYDDSVGDGDGGGDNQRGGKCFCVWLDGGTASGS